MTDLRFESHNFWSENPTLEFLRPNQRSEILILGLKGLILALRDLNQDMKSMFGSERPHLGFGKPSLRLWLGGGQTDGQTKNNCPIQIHRSLATLVLLPKRMRNFSICESIGHQILWGCCQKRLIIRLRGTKRLGSAFATSRPLINYMNEPYHTYLPILIQ